MIVEEKKGKKIKGRVVQMDKTENQNKTSKQLFYLSVEEKCYKCNKEKSMKIRCSIVFQRMFSKTQKQKEER